MHVCNSALGVRRRGIQYVRNAAVRQELAVDWHFQILNVAIVPEDLAQVRFIDVFCELLDHDFGAARLAFWARRPW